jgi:hypothetical protein
MAMRLLRATEVPATPRDRVFRSSPLYGVLFVLACFGLCAGMIVSRWPGPRLAYYLSATILIFLLLMHKLVVARFSPSNWLVRVADDGLFIHFRSYLNDHLSAEDPTVVFLPYPDIRSTRLIRERLQTLDSDGARSVQTRRLVELELAIDPAPLAAALATECARSAAWERRWYGRSATLYNDYPVIRQSPPFLRLEWQVAPRASVFLDCLRQRVQIAPPVAISEDFTNLQGLSRERQEQRLRELNQRGHTIDAVYMARRLYGLDLTQASKFVKELSEGVGS